MSVNKILVNNNDSNYTHSIFDISEYTGNSYSTLSDALNAIPQAKQKGGMTIRYIDSYDKYVQYRLMSDTFNTTPANWQGVDDEPIGGSDNLVKSGGVSKAIEYVTDNVVNTISLEPRGIDSTTGENNNSGLRVARTKNYIIAPFEITTNEGYKINSIWKYAITANKTISFVENISIDNNNVNVIDNEYIYRITFSKIDTSGTIDSEINNIVDRWKCSVSSINSVLNNIVQNTLEVSFVQGKYINSNGTESNSEQQVEASGYVFCKGLKFIKASVVVQISGVYIAFYDINKNFISTYKNNSFKVGYIHTIPVPNNACFVRCSNQYNYVENPWFIGYGVISDKDLLIISIIKNDPIFLKYEKSKFIYKF